MGHRIGHMGFSPRYVTAIHMESGYSHVTPGAFPVNTGNSAVYRILFPERFRPHAHGMSHYLDRPVPEALLERGRRYLCHTDLAYGITPRITPASGLRIVTCHRTDQ